MKKVKTVFWLLVLAAAVYAGYLFAMPQYRYYSFETDARDIVRFRIQNDEEMRAKLLEKAKDIGIPLTEQDIHITRDARDNFVASMTWHETVNLLTFYSKQFEFRVDVGEGLRK